MIIGLVGQIGAGKSTVAGILADLGCVVYDADAEARRVFEVDDVQTTMRSWWGDEVVGKTGRVERPLVGRLVFDQPEARLRLESLIHPRLADAREHVRAAAIEKQAPAAIIDAPLLYEARIDDECDAVVCVIATDRLRLDRVAARGWDASELARRDAAQIDSKEKQLRADAVIENSSDLNTLRHQVERVLEALLDAFLSGRS